MGNAALSNTDFEKLFLEYFRPLTVFAQQFVTDQMLAEDIVHDIFLKLFESKEKYSKESLTKNYLFRAVHNRCINQLNHQKIRNSKNKEVQNNLSGTPSDPLEIAQSIEFEHKFLQTLELLTPTCRKVFEMSRLEGIKNKDIAIKLGISKRTVETHISQALKLMRKKLIKYLPLMTITFMFCSFFSTCISAFNCFN